MCPPVFDRYVPALDVTGVTQASVKGGEKLTHQFERCVVEKPDHRHHWLLRVHHDRPRRYTSRQRDELPPSHLRSITWLRSPGYQVSDTTLREILLRNSCTQLRTALGHQEVPARDSCTAARGFIGRRARPIHSMTSSARRSRVFGTERPIALAVLRLMISSILAACSTGRSAGFSPLSTRPV
jgi:hypothetical protein